MKVVNACLLGSLSGLKETTRSPAWDVAHDGGHFYQHCREHSPPCHFLDRIGLQKCDTGLSCGALKDRSQTTQNLTGTQQTFASRFCSAFIMGWLGILLCSSLILEFRLTEQLLPGTVLVTTAGGEERRVAKCAV